MVNVIPFLFFFVSSILILFCNLFSITFFTLSTCAKSVAVPVILISLSRILIPSKVIPLIAASFKSLNTDITFWEDEPPVIDFACCKSEPYGSLEEATPKLVYTFNKASS